MAGTNYYIVGLYQSYYSRGINKLNPCGTKCTSPSDNGLSQTIEIRLSYPDIAIVKAEERTPYAEEWRVTLSCRMCKGRAEAPKLSLLSYLCRYIDRIAPEKRRVWIEWVNGWVKEKLALGKFYRCWTFGYLTRDFKGSDRSENCLNCGKARLKQVVCTRTKLQALC